ncbi:MAG TPA: CHAD domain-containing protein [Nitrososphaerales archaeon]|nr:CHAD domain-containing protein [Nitrososphaerales archaeon]
MAISGPSSKAFVRMYLRRTKGLLELADGFTGSLSPDAVHDLRVSARRAQVLCRLLPKVCRRSEEQERFAGVLSSLLKATSRIRDLDTLTLTLERARGSLPAELFHVLNRERENSLRGAVRAIEAVSMSSPPGVESSQIDAKKLAVRFRKRADRRAKVIGELVGKVLADESRVADLHALRKESKKLRYLLELSEGRPPELSVLEAWQESLGAIHDLDVAINYLRRSRVRLPKQDIIAKLERSRHRGYKGFTRRYEEDTAAARLPAILLTAPT